MSKFCVALCVSAWVRSTAESFRRSCPGRMKTALVLTGIEVPRHPLLLTSLSSLWSDRDWQLRQTAQTHARLSIFANLW